MSGYQLYSSQKQTDTVASGSHSRVGYCQLQVILFFLTAVYLLKTIKMKYPPWIKSTMQAFTLVYSSPKQTYFFVSGTQHRVCYFSLQVSTFFLNAVEQQGWHVQAALHRRSASATIEPIALFFTHLAAELGENLSLTGTDHHDNSIEWQIREFHSIFAAHHLCDALIEGFFRISSLFPMTFGGIGARKFNHHVGALCCEFKIRNAQSIGALFVF